MLIMMVDVDKMRCLSRCSFSFYFEMGSLITFTGTTGSSSLIKKMYGMHDACPGRGQRHGGHVDLVSLKL